MRNALLFVHIGDALPPYLDDALFQARLFTAGPIVLVAASRTLAAAPPDPGLGILTVEIESLPVSTAHQAFLAHARPRDGFRFGFWTYVIERFFLIEAAMAALGLEAVLHLETDNLLFADPGDLCLRLRATHAGLGVPFLNHDRAVAGVLFVRDLSAIARFTTFIGQVFAENPGVRINDMGLLAGFATRLGPAAIDGLPVLPAQDPGPMRRLIGGDAGDPALFTNHGQALGVLFDAGVIGQYLDGIDPRNTNGQTTVGFINEYAAYQVHRRRFERRRDGDGRLVPMLCAADRRWPIANLHLHSKNLEAFLSRPRPTRRLPLPAALAPARAPWDIAPDEIITSERVQTLADISLLDDSSFAEDPSVRENKDIRVCRLAGPRHHLIVDGAASIRPLQGARVLFVPTHLLDSFIAHVLPHLPQRFVLLTHASDHAVTARHRALLEDARLIHWFAQNAAIRHPKLTALPIGLANRHWAHGDLGAVAEVARRRIPKTSPLYLNIEVATNPAHRQPIHQALAPLPFVTNAPRRPFRGYLEEMARHRFCVSPHGNGLDCHRTWEALYLGVIPIVPAGPWMADFADLPLLAVERWDDLGDLEVLATHEARIRADHRPLDKLLLNHWRARVHAAARDDASAVATPILDSPPRAFPPIAETPPVSLPQARISARDIASRGLAHHRDGRLVEARRAYRQALALAPTFTELLSNLGAIHLVQGDPEGATRVLTRALRLEPDHPLALNNLGVALRDLGRFGEAAAVFERALEIAPDDARAMCNLGSALTQAGDEARAIIEFENALATDPTHTQARVSLALAHQRRIEHTLAIGHLRLVRDQEPQRPEHWAALGNALARACRHVEARDALFAPVDWASAPPATQSLRLLTLGCMADVPAAELARLHRQTGRAIEAGVRPIARPPAEPLAGRRLRIGYLSADYGFHPVGRFLAAPLAAHDPAVVEVFRYADVQRLDALGEHFRAQAEVWRPVGGMPDEALAARIAEDRIDVLVELGGHTANNRLAMLAMRPAPIQVSWLGYANTTGLSAIDYRITDPVADPPGVADALHSERLIRLDGGFLCFGPPTPAPPVAPPPMATNGFITFGSFNALPKLNGAVLALWGRVIASVPGSRLVLKCGNFADEPCRRWVMAALLAAGAPKGSITLLPGVPGHGEHLAAYGLIDVALDPFPHNGTTTTCETLFMGVPVITLAGERHAARVGASLLTRVGLDKLVARDEDGYVAAARWLAGSLQNLVELRFELRTLLLRSSLCDAPRFARTLEATYRAMAEGRI